jgi:hypothetical protein
MGTKNQQFNTSCVIGIDGGQSFGQTAGFVAGTTTLSAKILAEKHVKAVVYLFERGLRRSSNLRSQLCSR